MEFSVSLRLFLNSAAGSPERLSADIAVRLEKTQSGEIQAELALTGDGVGADKTRLKNDLAGALGIPAAGVKVLDDPPAFACSRTDHLRTVNEEV